MLVKTQNSETSRLIDKVHAVSRVCRMPSLVALPALMFLVTFDVIGRYFLDKPIKGTFEVSEFMLVAMVAFSIAYTQSVGQHINADLVLARLPQRTQTILNTLYHIVAVIFFVLIIISSINQAIHDIRTSHASEVLHIPFAIARLFIPAGCALMVLELLGGLFDSIRKLARGN